MENRSPRRCRSRRRLAAVCLLALVWTAGACGRSGEPEGPRPLQGPAETVALYRANCLSCHGAALEGQVGPETNLTRVGADLDREAIRRKIETGGDLMPAFSERLDAEEIAALADWLAGMK